MRRRACEIATTYAGDGRLTRPTRPSPVRWPPCSTIPSPPSSRRRRGRAANALRPRPASCARLAELATGHEDALCREAAVAALGALGDPAGLPAILAATTDKATVRRRAVIALAPFDGPEVDAALERARTDRDWQVRQAAEDLLTP